MYYAADNSYSSATDIGFANTWYVLAFPDRKTRDQYVANSPRLAARKIQKREIGHYIDRPEPFSGKCWIFVPDGRPGQATFVALGYPDEGERVYPAN